MTFEPTKDGKCRILSLDGGGAKGFYTLGVLKEIEGILKCPLHKRFDLIFGTSTGSIIAALLCLGKEIDQIHDLYREHVIKVVSARGRKAKSDALRRLADDVFGELRFDAVKTGVGIVATKWVIERPMIFKGTVEQAHGRKGTFAPGFGCTISDAVQASCSAVPFFERKTVITDKGHAVELIDGGYCANNPTLYAIADALAALNVPRDDIRVVSVGVGAYPAPKPTLKMRILNKFEPVQLLQKTFEINTQSMDQLRTILFKDIQTVRISDSFSQPEMATDLFEHDLSKLDVLRQRGSESFAQHEAQLRSFLLP
jgi:patatin-like phospholipase/acyl hydrolase